MLSCELPRYGRPGRDQKRVLRGGTCAARLYHPDEHHPDQHHDGYRRPPSRADLAA
jgi:hypothetical protein